MKTVAVVIPCRNEEKYIAACLTSVLAQDYPSDKIQVYVCDGRSNDSTASIINDFAIKNKNVHLLINQKQTTPHALNLGIKNSNSDIIIILGAHSELYPDYVSMCISEFDSMNNIGCVGGVIENVYLNKDAEAIGKAMSSGFGVGNAHFRTGSKDGLVDTVAFGAYRREVFNTVGFFDEELTRNQDDEFNYRIKKAGFKIYLSFKIRSKYYVRASFVKLFKQYFQYGYWKVYVNKKHKTITSWRQLVPLFFVLYLPGGLLFILRYQNLFYLYVAGLIIYILLSAVKAAMLSANLFQIIKIMWSFFILHFSYGLGYLLAIINFFVLPKKIRKQE